VIGICCWGVAVEISQTASVTALEPVQGPMQCKDEGLVWRSLSDTVALCQLGLSLQTGLDFARSPRVRKDQVNWESLDLPRDGKFTLRYSSGP
jgi:hypothetical protein